jgi:DNA-directed RNA polymerase specialized sigma24 family protein
MTWNAKDHKSTASECRALFAVSQEELRWLCHTLTGDPALSTEVLQAALAQALKGANDVFRDWMLSWSRRLIVKFCIAHIQPQQSPLALCAYPASFTASRVSHRHVRELLALPSSELQHKLLQLEPLSRFVFVLRALEGYNRRDTSLLLNIDDRACEWIFLWTAGTLTSELRNRDSREQRSSFLPDGTEIEAQQLAAAL